jgi:hypothetical protein
VWKCVSCQLLLGWLKWGKDMGRICGMLAEEKCIECLMGKHEKNTVWKT